MQPITGVVQHYPWGDQRFIPELFGAPPDGTPWAELWLGTHPNGPATLADGRAARRRHRHAAVPAQGARRGRAAVAADPPDAEQAQAGYHAGRYPDPTRSRSCSAR